MDMLITRKPRRCADKTTEGVCHPPGGTPADREDWAIDADAPARIFSERLGEISALPKKRIRNRDRTGEYSTADYHRRYYLEGWRDKRLSRARAKKLRFIAERGGRCMDCGFSGPPECFHFDHRPGTKKVGDVGKMFYCTKMSKVLAEVAKCDLVCANCHAIRTKARGAGRRRTLTETAA